MTEEQAPYHAIEAQHRGAASTQWLIDEKGTHCVLILKPKREDDEDIFIPLVTGKEMNVRTVELRQGLRLAFAAIILQAAAFLSYLLF